ncbi:hypothetical protein LVD17_13990 [Fulvivirga ulvae]|uniref:hypothetical protein n=1 Tax=Fulvivirga ulvae TaxID=2904245 RepID=UPI001F193049|nr:hypothetical protein [Fulvivirga ulvae]UII34918.1 hypothetical protein LVD17_13990 [Fulvivirga ulvae]
MNRVLLLIMVFVTAGCNQYRPTEARLEITKDNFKKNNDPVQGNFKEVGLKEKMSALSLGGARNIGEFFDHRLIFYKVDYPAMSIGRSSVEELVFYFMDSALVKLRYKVRGDVSDFLLDSLGLSRFKPLDEYSMQQLDSGSIVQRYGGYYELNKKLENYELVWREGNTVSRFRVSNRATDSLMTCFFYHEIDGYDSKIREMEQLYNAVDRNTYID